MPTGDAYSSPLTGQGTWTHSPVRCLGMVGWLLASEQHVVIKKENASCQPSAHLVSVQCKCAVCFAQLLQYAKKEIATASVVHFLLGRAACSDPELASGLLLAL